VLKSASDSDARAVVLSLSRRGAALHQRVMALIDRRNREIMACLSAAERKALLTTIDRLIVHAEAGGDTPGTDFPALGAAIKRGHEQESLRSHGLRPRRHRGPGLRVAGGHGRPVRRRAGSFHW